MESFSSLKRRTTDMLSNVQLSLPSMPSVASSRKSGIKGTWERIDAPAVPRSSHSLDIISGTAYVFGGEIQPREPVDNHMHVITLPWSSAGADYYKIEAVAEKQNDQAQQPHQSEPDASTRLAVEQEAPEPLDPAQESTDRVNEKNLDEVSLASPGLPDPSGDIKGKGKELGGPEPATLGNVPAPRVGHATAVIGSRIFLFGGRGGAEMKPLEEGGRVWVFDTRSHAWSYLDPAPAIKGGAIIPHPAPRSYHCATATDRPRIFASARPKKPETWQQWAVGDISKTGIPQDPIIGNVAEDAVDEESDGYGTFFVHGGCLSNGDRTNDLWAFNVHDSMWYELPAGPGPARGGTALAISKSRLFRFGGFDGKAEIGGQLDFLHLEMETFDDQGSKGEIALRARGGWQSILADNPDASSHEIPSEPEQEWPVPRSVAAFEAITVGGGREYLVLAMGERDPSSDGHAGAGKFLDDVWLFQVPPLGMSTASVTAAVLQAVGRKTGEGKWTKVDLAPYDDDNSDEMPEQRGWLSSAVMVDLEESAILVWGGLGEDNQRLGDGWILRLGE